MKKLIVVLSFLAMFNIAQATDHLSRSELSRTTEIAPGTQFCGFTPTEREMWDVLFAFETTSSSQSGVATDGKFIYSSSFSSNLFRKFEMDGTFVEEFEIPGVPSVNCMTYSGTHFYGAQGDLANGIYILDLDNHQLLGTIPVTASTFIAIGHISYDPGLDGGNGGFWVGYWYEMAAVDMNGNEIIANAGSPEAIGGTAFDNITDPDKPCLYAFIRSGDSQREFYRFDINTRTYSGVLHVATDIPGASMNPLASGCNSFVNPDGKLVLLGMIDHFPENEVIFGYEIAQAFSYDNDISLQRLVSPTTGPGLLPAEEVTVRILNNGTTVQTGFDVQYTLNDGESVLGPFTQTVTEVIEPGQMIDFTFDETANLATPGASYTFAVTALLSGDENQNNDSLTKTIQNTSGVYCYASGGGGSEYIRLVTVGDFTNSSGNSAYSNYTTDPELVIGLEPGTATPMQVDLYHGYNADLCAVWVDWNGDGDFADDGAVYVSSFGPGPYNCSITPPEYALRDCALRMRIRLDYNNPTPEPCGTTTFGEVEDYTVIVSAVSGVDDQMNPVPRLVGNYPNPFNPTTTISFVTTSDKEKTEILVYDIKGREIIALVNEKLPAGPHQVVWDGKNRNNKAVSSGLYFYKLVSGKYSCSRKMLLLK